jgi:hypothetical protein
MTDAQKKSRARFKAAVSEAAKLRKKNPRLSQADAVKQAWAILYGKERAGKKIAGPKKPAKKTATKKATKAGERHTDTKSHNVNIRVMSGVKSDIKKRLKQSGKRLKHGYSLVPGEIRKLSGLSRIIGTPHKSKYYIKYKTETQENKIEYFDKLPKGIYYGSDKIAYLLRMTNAGTSLIPLHKSANDKPHKKM